MKVKSKFKLRETGYIMIDNKIVEITIDTISIVMSVDQKVGLKFYNWQEISYKCKLPEPIKLDGFEDVWFIKKNESDIYKTKQELKDLL